MEPPAIAHALPSLRLALAEGGLLARTEREGGTDRTGTVNGARTSHTFAPS
jgi:hypothetical protein